MYNNYLGGIILRNLETINKKLYLFDLKICALGFRIIVNIKKTMFDKFFCKEVL